MKGEEMTQYLASYAYDDGDGGGAGALGLYGSPELAVGRAVCDFRDEAPIYADEADGRAWYRVDVYTYSGDSMDQDEAFEDVMDSCEADGDVLHIDISGGEIHVEIYDCSLRLRGSIV